MSSRKVKILNIDEITDQIMTFTFERPEAFNFEPGQYVFISLPDISPAPMAIASGNNEPELLFTVRKWGQLTTELFKMAVGDTVLIDGPYGSYFPEDKMNETTKLYLIGGGTGITPIRSLIKSSNNLSNIELFYGALDPKQLIYQSEYLNWNIDFHLTVDNPDPSWKGNTGFVTSLLDQHALTNTAICFVCGPKPMMETAVNYLRNKGFIEDNIFVSLEKFDQDGNVVGPVLPISDPLVNF